MAMKEIGVLNVRGVPRKVVQLFKGQAAVAGFTMQDAIVLLLRAVGDGSIQLQELEIQRQVRAKKEKV
jgi:hypothetical protein